MSFPPGTRFAPGPWRRTNYQGTSLYPSASAAGMYRRVAVAPVVTRRSTKRYAASVSRVYKDKFSTLNMRSDPVYPRPEVKNIDTQIGSVSSDPMTQIYIDSNPGYVNDLTNIPKGTGATDRIGRKVAIKSCYYQFMVYINPLATVPAIFRFMLVWDRQPNETGADSSFAANLLSTQPYATSPLSLTQTNRFVIVADERFTLSPNGTDLRTIQGFRKIDQFSTYDDSGSDVPESGALRLFLVSDIDTADNPPYFYSILRVRYIDN